MNVCRFAGLASCLSLVVAFAAFAAQPNSKQLQVPRRAQEQPRWCWAACAQMVMAAASHSVTQCTQALNRCTPNPCACAECPSGSANPCSSNVTWPACNTGGWPDFPCFGFSAVHTNDAALPWGTLRSEINAGRPFVVSWRYTNLTQPSTDADDGHMVVATGYQVLNGEKYVRYVDPLTQGAACGLTEAKKITFAHYKQGPSWTHWDDYFLIKPVLPASGCAASASQAMQ